VRVEGIDWNLDVRFREKTFSGKVLIRTAETPDPLTIDAAGLEITSSMVDDRPASFEVDTASGTLKFPGLAAGPHRVELAYRGAVDPNSLVGLYVSPAGKEYCLTTMLFPTGSRRLLPTFEDPTVKTVYRLTVTTEPDLKVIFNSAPEAKRLADGRLEVTFAPTPPMSAYLLYLGIGPFDTLTVPGRPWSVTVAASPGRAAAGRYCAERASEILAAYEEYYRVPYPLPKLDLVALENFWAGAMENWGAIAFRESVVLVDPTTTVLDRRIDLIVLAHEIAHQWFGDLVTPIAWDDFWLNESFATFVGHHIVGRRYPAEHPWTYFLYRYYGRALDQDALTVTHPVKVPVASPEELGEIADDVTYGKGASVLRMIEAYLGESTFREGLSRYLNRHRFSNARAEDLWGALAEVSREPVERVMTAWITRPGFPVIHASWSNGTLSLRQSRFRADGTSPPEVWPIPLRLSTREGEVSLLFETPSIELKCSDPNGLRINPERAAFVRILYDDVLYERLLKEFPSRSPIDQWGAVVDGLAFLMADLLPLPRFLDLVRAGAAMTDEAPVIAMADALTKLYLILPDDPTLVEAARGFVRGQLERIGLEPRPGDSDSDRLLREWLAETLAGLDLEFARELSRRFTDLDRAPVELRPAIAVSYARAEGPGAFEPLVNRLRSTQSDGERAQLLRALGSFDDPGLLRRSLDLIPSPGVTPAGALELFRGLVVNPAAGSAVLQWYQEKFQEVSRMWAGTPLLSIVLSWGLPSLGLGHEEDFERFFRDHTPPEARLGLAQGLETLRLWSGLRSRSRSATNPG